MVTQYLALLFGLEIVAANGLRGQIEVESDSLMVISEVNKGFNTMSRFGNLVVNILALSSV